MKSSGILVLVELETFLNNYLEADRLEADRLLEIEVTLLGLGLILEGTIEERIL